MNAQINPFFKDYWAIEVWIRQYWKFIICYFFWWKAWGLIY
jgi:hypothetical protein